MLPALLVANTGLCIVLATRPDPHKTRQRLMQSRSLISLEPTRSKYTFDIGSSESNMPFGRDRSSVATVAFRSRKCAPRSCVDQSEGLAEHMRQRLDVKNSMAYWLRFRDDPAGPMRSSRIRVRNSPPRPATETKPRSLRLHRRSARRSSMR